MHRTFSRLAIIGAAFAVLIGLSILTTGQPASKLRQRASPHHVGVVDDWSFHHLVFSNPGTYEQVKNDPAAYSRWLNIQYDTRFIMQQMKRATGAKPLADLGIASTKGLAEPEFSIFRPRARKKGTTKKDWSVGLTTGTVQPNTFPAKFSFSTTTASCASDYVVYPTGAAGTGTLASIVAYNNLYVGTGACEATLPTVYWAYNTGATISTSPVISQGGDQVAFMQVSGTTASLVLLKWLQSPTPPTGVTGTTTASSTSVTITAGTVTKSDVGMQISGSGIPSYDTIAAVSGSTVTLATAATASHTAEALTITAEALVTPGVPPSAASAAAYRSCTAPCMYTMTLSGSPNDTFSAPFYDYWDDELYVGDDGGKLHQFTGVFGPGNPGENTTSPWPLTLDASDKVTSPVYDPVSGYVFVGDTGGYLYAVGTGNQSTSTGTKHGTSSALGGAIIDGPLVDPSAGTVYAFVPTNGTNNAVFQFSTAFTGGTGNAAATGTALGSSTGGATEYLYAGAFDNVYFESTTTPPSGNLYVVGGTGLSGGGGVLYQIPIVSSTFVGTNHTSTSITVTSGTVTAADVGAAISGSGIPTGDYITGFSSPTVTLHAASTNSDTGVTFTITGMGTPASAVTVNDSHYPWPSPLTEFCNNGASACSLSAGGTATTGGIDYIFFSVYHSSAGSSCDNSSGHGCVVSYNVSTPSSITEAGTGMPVTTAGASGSAGCWATGGIVVDNAVASGTQVGASQFYLINLNGNDAGGPTGGTKTSGTCYPESGNTIEAVQASQSSP